MTIKDYNKGDKYVALSYLWGGTPAPATISGEFLEDQLPRAIQDAIFITRKIGLRSIWIDRYCISPNEQVRDEQIQNMDHIYTRAVLTVVSFEG